MGLKHLTLEIYTSKKSKATTDSLNVVPVKYKSRIPVSGGLHHLFHRLAKAIVKAACFLGSGVPLGGSVLPDFQFHSRLSSVTLQG